MPVYLKIDNCASCPFCIMTNRPGKLMNVPACLKTGDDLPYRVGINSVGRPINSTSLAVAIPTATIPEWCPLRGDNDEN